MSNDPALNRTYRMASIKYFPSLSVHFCISVDIRDTFIILLQTAKMNMIFTAVTNQKVSSKKNQENKKTKFGNIKNKFRNHSNSPNSCYPAPPTFSHIPNAVSTQSAPTISTAGHSSIIVLCSLFQYLHVQYKYRHILFDKM